MKKYYVVRCTNRTSRKESDKGKDRCLFSTFWSGYSKEEADCVAEELNASVVPAEAEIFGTEFKVLEVEEGEKLQKKSDGKESSEASNKNAKKTSEEKTPSKSSVNSTL